MVLLGRNNFQGEDLRLESQQSSVAEKGGAAPDCRSSSSSSRSSSSSSSSSSSRWEWMGDDDEKVNLIGDLNSALASQWVCSVRSTFWEEGCFSMKKEKWGKQKKVHEI